MSLKGMSSPEKNKIELEFAIEKEAFDKAVNDAYKKNVGKINVPGFRKGKAPKSIIEKMYGKGVFYDDALNALIPDAYEAALKESAAEPVGAPEFDVASIDENGVVVKATFFVKPEVEIENYKGIKVERKVAPVTDEELDSEIDRVRNRNSRTIDVTDRPAKDGDIAVIDYEGFVDGKAFEGGKGEKHNLKLGSGEFIPGFEEGVVGHNVGDNFDVDVTFPEDYHAKELAGKKATFKVVLHEIKFVELPELDDEFAKDVSEFDTFDEYKKSVKATIEERHEKTADNEVEEQLIDALIENLKADIPEVMFDNEVEQELRDYANRLGMQGLDLRTYMQYTGMDLDGMRAQFRPRAERQVKTRLALEKIAALENIEPTDKDIDDEYTNIANAYGMEAKAVKDQIPADMIAADVKVRKAVEFVKANAEVSDKKPAAKKSTAKKTAKAETEGEAPAEEAKKSTAKKAAPKKTAAKKAE